MTGTPEQNFFKKDVIWVRSQCLQLFNLKGFEYIHKILILVTLKGLFGRPAAVAPILPLAWELPHAMGTVLKSKKKKKKKKKFLSIEGQ